MKRLIWVICITMLASCNTKQASTPSGAMQAFFEAAKTGEIAAMKKHISKRDLAMLEMGQAFMKNLDSSAQRMMENKLATQYREKMGDAKLVITDEKIDGDKATLKVSFAGKEQHAPMPFSLLKEDGEWKVSLIASGLEASGKTEADLQKGMEDMGKAMKDLPAIQDSIKKVMNGLSKDQKDSLQKLLKDHKEDIDKLQNMIKQQPN